MVQRAPLVAGHRGAPRLAPENTIPGFEAALACGADMLEFDVRRTRDQRLVLCHDASFGGHAVAGLDLNGLRAGAARLDTLEEALGTIRGRAAIDVELKEPGYEAEVVELVHARFGSDGATFSSFDPASVEALAGLPGVVRIGLNVEDDSLRRHGLPGRGRELVRRARDMGATVLAPNVRLLSATLLAEARSAGMPVYVWTVNDPETIRAILREPAVAVIISDLPDLAVRLRDERSDLP